MSYNKVEKKISFTKHCAKIIVKNKYIAFIFHEAKIL